MAKILIADDSSFMREVIIKALKSAGYKDFVEASNGTEAIKLFKTEKPALTLLDIIMGPPLSGLDVLKEIIKVDKKAKVIMVTVIDQPKVTAQAKKLGAKGYVTKPIDAKILTGEVKNLIG